MTDPNQPPKPTLRGILLVDKPVGPTSMDVCRRVRRACRRGGLARGLKVGHGGTLDPMASGLVVTLIGKSTRLCEAVMAGTKEYIAEVDLAHVSESCDLESEPVAVAIEKRPGEADVREACARFRGMVEQRPPAHSAVRVDGRRAYELAREGTSVEMPARLVRIDDVTLERFEWPMATIKIVCGKGTYIRSLARDLGATLGVGGMLRGLRRTKVGPFDVEDALPLDDLPEVIGQEHLRDESALGG